MHGSSVVLISLLTSALTTTGGMYLIQRYQVFAPEPVARSTPAPLLVGLTEADARANTAALQVPLLVEGREPSPGVAAGTVVRQSIPPGHPVPEGAGIGVTFAARRLTADPRLIVLVSTSALLFSGSIGPLVNYISDRIWTPWGRRRPFVVTAYFLSAVGLAVIPLADTLTTFALAVACHGLVHSFASPMEPLYMELVPGSQQGRAQAMRNAGVQLGVLFFFSRCFRRIDGLLISAFGAGRTGLFYCDNFLNARQGPFRKKVAPDGGAPLGCVENLAQAFRFLAGRLDDAVQLGIDFFVGDIYAFGLGHAAEHE